MNAKVTLVVTPLEAQLIDEALKLLATVAHNKDMATSHAAGVNALVNPVNGYIMNLALANDSYPSMVRLANMVRAELGLH